MSTLSWLHLSDLHFKTSTQWDENIVLRALLDDVREQIQANDLRFDFVALTGDIAFQSKPEEYGLARQFFDDLLKETGLSKDRLILMPGNHDVDRGLISKGAKFITKSIDSRDALNEILSTDKDRQLIMDKFTHFYDFINELTDDSLLYNGKRYYQAHRFQVADKSLAVLALNSAWLCMGDEDHGKIALGERQVREALEDAEDADLLIALMHHPFDWLHEFDRSDCEPLLMQGCDFILHGHLHRTGILSLTTPDEDAMIIAAGASYQTRDFPNCYNFVQVDLETGQGVVHLRRYSDERGGFWTKDVMTYRNVNNGQFNFNLGSMVDESINGQVGETQALPTDKKLSTTEQDFQNDINAYCQSIDEAIQVHRSCRFVVTCRFAGYTDQARLCEQLLEMHLRPLSFDQVKTFVNYWSRGWTTTP